MPFKKGAKKGGWKKGKRPARKDTKGPTKVVRMKQVGIPDKLIVKLPYVDTQRIYTTGTPTVPYAQKSYRANSIWDPEASVGNSSALFMREYAGIYQRYRVFGVSYKVILANESTSSMTTGALTFNQDGEPPDETNPVSWGVPFTRKFCLGSSLTMPKTISGYISMPRILGLTSEQYRTDDHTWGLMTQFSTGGSNPDKLLNMYLSFLNANSSAQCVVNAQVSLVYHVELFDRVRIYDAPVPE